MHVLNKQALEVLDSCAAHVGELNCVLKMLLQMYESTTLLCSHLSLVFVINMSKSPIFVVICEILLMFVCLFHVNFV